ncbi:winged helix-turn-helix domain-containing protein [Candidatus Poribacteria bacterium]
MSTARKLATRCQGLDAPWKLPKGKEGIAQVIERLGYVQIDTISVVQRAHHHTLWSRRSDYTPQMLHELQAQDRRVFEWWGHAASYLPMCDYRYYLPRMRAAAERQKTRDWLGQNAQLVKGVVDRIRDEGPLGSSDFSAPEGKRGSWWDWKPAKRVLETLFNTGEMMVTERRNFQRIYDLTERVLPAGTDTTEPGQDEIARFVIHRVLARGFTSVDAMRHTDGVSEAMEELVDSGEVVPVEIRGLDDEQYYALTRNVEEASKRSRRRIHILSPFDNLVIDRRRLRELFGFDYRLECYLPAAKRRHGYFCLPVLWGREFVGRLDSKADRKKKTFIVRKMVFEPGLKDYERLLPELAERLHEFATFNGCERIVVEEIAPDKAKLPFIRELGIDNTIPS